MQLLVVVPARFEVMASTLALQRRLYIIAASVLAAARLWLQHRLRRTIFGAVCCSSVLLVPRQPASRC